MPTFGTHTREHKLEKLFLKNFKNIPRAPLLGAMAQWGQMYSMGMNSRHETVANAICRPDKAVSARLCQSLWHSVYVLAP